MGEHMKNPYSFWAKIITFVFIILVIVIGLFLEPNINFDDAVNGTNWIYGNTYELKFETVPTLINGITAVTSIIIGFSGAMVGLVYREDFTKDKKVKKRLLALAFYSVVPLTILLLVYHSLTFGAFEFAMKWALFALILALADFVISMLAIFYRLDKQSKPESESKENQSPIPEHANEKSIQKDNKAIPPTKENEILELVQWIDDNESKLIKLLDDFGGMGRLFFMVFVALYIIATIVNLTIPDFATQISLHLTSLAILIATITLVLKMGERKAQLRFERAIKVKEFSDREKTLLRALIKIKSNNEEVKLMTIYEMDKEAHGDIFTEKKLLESICKYPRS
jgi:hypothetical protein